MRMPNYRSEHQEALAPCAPAYCSRKVKRTASHVAARSSYPTAKVLRKASCVIDWGTHLLCATLPMQPSIRALSAAQISQATPFPKGCSLRINNTATRWAWPCSKAGQTCLGRTCTCTSAS
ncbi:hypothetical protein XpiCFBP4643_22620 [Xanthomonas pisi]|uniref:Uncharacterized protein n=1 Tax=Xanthomonas pisi TaxID=56457 RepID=A0A2S7CRC5_9XANT|nr:hypothetical protein XpiCFBP4643_22620 [Xanthomonas pisi]